MRSIIGTRVLLAASAAALVVASGCGDDADAGGEGAGAGGGAGGSAGGSGGEVGGGGGEVCVPRTCGEVELACGTFSDGCGASLRCWEACDCSPDDFEARCPSRACETAAGCSDAGRCVYEPVVCGEPCRCALDDCAGDTPRSCGDALCSAQFCLPSPVSDGEVVRYGNVCAPADEASCGTCGLGRLTCDPRASTLACEDLDLAGDVNPDRVECDSGLTSSTFVFLDPAFPGVGSDGSREAPFTTLGDALDAAAMRGARAVIVGGAPVVLERPAFVEGISVYGGNTGYPLWRRDEQQIPSWKIPYDGAPGGLFVGVWIERFRRETVLADLAIHTTSLSGVEDGPGLSNYGLYVLDSPGLRLHRVEVTAGNASDGGPGSPGEAAPPASAGLAGAPTTGLIAESSCVGPRYHICSYEQAGGDDACQCGYDTGSNSCIWATITDPPQSCVSCPDVGAVPFTAGGDGGAALVVVDIYDAGGGVLRPWTTPWVSVTPPSPAGLPQLGNDQAWWWQARWPEPGFPGPDAPLEPPIQSSSGRVVRLPEERDGLWAFHLSEAGRGFQGRAGRPGGGGGGGMGGLGWGGYQTGSSSFIVGAGGGGGGAGACGGGGGHGGWPGGYSVALFVVRSPGLVAKDSVFTSGRAGRGGDGGPGGASTVGGLGGPTGALDPSLHALYDSATCSRWLDGPEQICLVLGASGGNGGRGQPGAIGGNGTGGSSIGGACAEGAIVLEGDTRFLGGDAGPGGASGAVVGPPGDSVTQRGCAPACGNGLLDPGEACDDGNDRERDGCGGDCTLGCADGSGADRALVDPATGRCLAAFLTQEDGAAAQARCAALGGALAALSSPITERAATLLVEPETRFLIGLGDGALEGTYAWPDGEAPASSRWCFGEPAGGEEQDCVVHRVDLGCWENKPCADFAPYLCELPVP